MTFLCGVGTAQASEFVVTNVNDSGPGSLRDAIAQANASPSATPDQITFQAGLSGTVQVTSGPMAITDSVTITASRDAPITLRAIGSRLLSVAAPTGSASPIDVSLSHLTFQNGDSLPLANGGALLAQGANVSISHCVFSDNTGQEGGAIYTSDAARLVIRSTQFYGNHALGDGGAIRAVNMDELQIVDSTLKSNVGEGTGGAVSAIVGVTRVDHSLFGNNQVHPTNANPPRGSGGALHVEGDRVEIRSSTLYNSTSFWDGGALSLQARGAAPNLITAQIDESTFDYNSAYERGGAIIARRATLVVDRSLFWSNNADRTGGVIHHSEAGSLTLWNSTLHDSHSAQGGAIHVRPGVDLSITGGTLTHLGGSGDGLAIRYEGDSPAQLRNTVVFSRSGTDLAGKFTPSYCLISDPSAATLIGGTGNLPAGTDPQLGAFSDQGGSSRVMMPLPGSPLIDAGDPVADPDHTQDQRGLPRVNGARTDIGAAETHAFSDGIFRDGFDQGTGSSLR
ncbi:choice-of-anchor Q domain-containing protein [Tahibacter amnicola]|uniref:Right-handed parallel beta-helix repeat-containing protein n=1 Tax=Tahibacter amnicola TaxID=2976241 RepID=A0ABY6BHH3_9GAMM|nr:choice-of-anchor Q domain-containing protein [Tahibacter amnicola]UXI69031.1 right-handed parallel beta-helix repeat-containing protein [Tahibacter amnicola]